MSRTTMAGIAGLLILAAGLAAWLLKVGTAIEITASLGLFIGIAVSLGLIAAKDQNAPQVVSQTTVQDVGKGKREVTVSTELPKENP